MTEHVAVRVQPAIAVLFRLDHAPAEDSFKEGLGTFDAIARELDPSKHLAKEVHHNFFGAELPELVATYEMEFAKRLHVRFQTARCDSVLRDDPKSR